MSHVRAFLRFWYEFIVGDDWRIAAGVTAVLVVGAVAVASGYAAAELSIALYVGLIVVFVVPILALGRRPPA